MAIGRAVVYSARAAHAFSAGIKCRHCMLQSKCYPLHLSHYPITTIHSLMMPATAYSVLKSWLILACYFFPVMEVAQDSLYYSTLSFVLIKLDI